MDERCVHGVLQGNQFRDCLSCEIERLTRRVAVLEAALKPFAVSYRSNENLAATLANQPQSFPDNIDGLFMSLNTPERAHEALEASDD